MSDADEIKQLELDMQKLSADLQTTQQQLFYLYQRLQQLQAKKGGQSFSSKLSAGVQNSFSLENFIGLRLIHLVGIVVLVIGLSIGVKYAIDRELISEWARIGLAYAAGVTLFLLSWRLRKKYSAFSAILFSGAMASLYFTTYAAFVYYGMLSFALTFTVMIALTLFTSYQALVYNRQEIVILGLVGAYGIPFLISTNTGRPEMLFTYIAVINTAVMYLSFKKRWKEVAYLAQAITWVLLLGWALTRFETGQQRMGIMFMAFFSLLFIAHALSNKAVRDEAITYRNVQQLFFNNLLLYFGALVLFAPAYSEAQVGRVTGIFAMLTALQGALCYYFFPQEAHPRKLLLLLSLSLLLIYVANEWDGLVVTLLWLLMAVAIFATGVASKTRWLRITALVLMGVTLAKLVVLDSQRFTTIQKIIAYITLGILLIVVGFFYQRTRAKWFGE